jgi:hypothetical protein
MIIAGMIGGDRDRCCILERCATLLEIKRVELEQLDLTILHRVRKPQFDQGRKGRLLLGLLLGVSPAGGVLTRVDLDADMEALGVIGAALLENRVDRVLTTQSLERLLQNGLEVVLVPESSRFGDQVTQMAEYEPTSGFESGIKEECPDE